MKFEVRCALKGKWAIFILIFVFEFACALALRVEGTASRYGGIQVMYRTTRVAKRKPPVWRGGFSLRIFDGNEACAWVIVDGIGYTKGASPSLSLSLKPPFKTK